VNNNSALNQWLIRLDKSFDRIARNPELLAVAASGINMLANNRVLSRQLKNHFKNKVKNENQESPFRDSSSVRLLEAAEKAFSKRSGTKGSHRLPSSRSDATQSHLPRRFAEA
jgi:hypothetical protein